MKHRAHKHRCRYCNRHIHKACPFGPGPHLLLSNGKILKPIRRFVVLRATA